MYRGYGRSGCSPSPMIFLLLKILSCRKIGPNSVQSPNPNPLNNYFILQLNPYLWLRHGPLHLLALRFGTNSFLRGFDTIHFINWSAKCLFSFSQDCSLLSGSLAVEALLIGVHCKKRYINVQVQYTTIQYNYTMTKLLLNMAKCGLLLKQLHSP